MAAPEPTTTPRSGRRSTCSHLAADVHAMCAEGGFSGVPSHRSVAPRGGGGSSARSWTVDDTAQIRALLFARTPTSDIYATRERGGCRSPTSRCRVACRVECSWSRCGIF
jgi:hypothetical protein